MAQIRKKALESNITKAKKLRKQGFRVGEVSFPTKKKALEKLKKSKISSARKKRLSVRQFKNIKTGGKRFVFVEKKK